MRNNYSNSKNYTSSKGENTMKKTKYDNKRNSKEKINNKNFKKEAVNQMNENVEINLNETLDGFENFVDAMFSSFQLALITEIYEDEDVKDEFSSIVADTYYEIDDYMVELKNISTIIYVCLQIAEASEEDYRDYLNRLKAIKSKLENLKGMLYFMANEMEVTLNV